MGKGISVFTFEIHEGLPPYEKRVIFRLSCGTSTRQCIGKRMSTDSGGEHYQFEGLGRESEEWKPVAWCNLVQFKIGEKYVKV